MGDNYYGCSVVEIFLGFLTGVAWLLLVYFGVIGSLLGILGLTGITTVLNIVITIVGLLAFLLFGICIFKRLWRCCWCRGSGGC
ncbi:hypothetical protein [Pontibacillus marinus]|uniref:hypothetical protein n=1 Tax=Pontibacillus marinus TaxID=273164 RepID=UPI000684019E|nr:hypothetical protein [Pontibacillus marinus]